MFTVDYGRPLMRGRKLLGDVLPYDRVWRTGANAATQFTTSAPIKLAGMQVPAGTYTLWTVPHTGAVDLIVNRQTGQWGTEYNPSHNLGIARITSQALPAPVEEFTISIVPDRRKAWNTCDGMGFLQVDGTNRSAVRSFLLRVFLLADSVTTIAKFGTSFHTTESKDTLQEGKSVLAVLASPLIADDALE